MDLLVCFSIGFLLAIPAVSLVALIYAYINAEDEPQAITDAEFERELADFWEAADRALFDGNEASENWIVRQNAAKGQGQ